MNTKREYVIGQLMEEGFIEREEEKVYLEEKEDTGQSVLELQLSSSENLSIKNVDKKKYTNEFFCK